MDFTERETLEFAREHQHEDTARLLLSAARYPAIDMPTAVQQIEGLRTAREKWPSLMECEEFLYPPRLNREQASSEATAAYKARLLSTLLPSGAPLAVADLTGGMGVDTLAFARVAQQVDYVERDAGLCALMEHNLAALGITNVNVHCAESMEWLASRPEFALLFADPARRDTHGRKVAAFEDCTPNLLLHAEQLRSHCRRLMVKASPMIDIEQACRQLGDVAEVHIVGVRGECKEVLFVSGPADSEPQINCVNLSVSGIASRFTFHRAEEAAAEGCYCQAVGRYLYEPDATLMKGGPYKLIGQRYGLMQLDRNSHLYTSDTLVADFPGRVFEVLRELKLSCKDVATAIPGGRAHVVTRNYPVKAEELQRQIGLQEGGDMVVVATTVGSCRCGFLCKI